MEIFSRDEPFYYVASTSILVSQLCEKELLIEIPEQTPEVMGRLMELCLQYEAHKRPDFSDICDMIAEQ